MALLFRKVTLLILFSIFILLTISAQNSIKIYTNFLYLNSSQEPRTYDYDPSGFSYNHLSFAYRYNNKADFVNEWELRGFLKSEAGDNHRVEQFGWHLRYELGKHLDKKLFNIFRVQFGVAPKIFSLHEDIKSLDYYEFPVTRDIGGLNLAFFAHLEYDISDRVYIDLNTSVTGLTAGFDFTKRENPALTERQQKQGGFDFDAFQEHILRLGVGFRLGYMGGEDEEDELQKEWDIKQKKKGKKNKKRKRKKRN